MYAADGCKEKNCFSKKSFEEFPKDSEFVGKFCTGKIENSSGEKVCCMKVIEWNFNEENLKTKKNVRKKRSYKESKNK